MGRGGWLVSQSRQLSLQRLFIQAKHMEGGAGRLPIPFGGSSQSYIVEFYDRQVNIYTGSIKTGAYVALLN